jgi:uncharacterized protein (TIGR03437 family)
MEETMTEHKILRSAAIRRLLLACLLLVLLCQAVYAQRRDRLAGPIDSRKLVTLRGSRNPRVARLTDEGPLGSAERIRGMGLRFRPSAEQSAALEQLVADQQNPASPLYRGWLTPEEFADRFGISEHDLARVSEWLEWQGFQVDSVARSRTWITFSGTAGQVRDTFRTELHRFRVPGRTAFANVTDASIPADLAALVYTLRGLDDLPDEPRGRAQSRLNLPDGAHALAPGDHATIYNLNPLWEKDFNGAGQKIVVAGKSALKIGDVQAFRSLFGLPKNDPTVILAPGYPDPGFNEEHTEVTADVEIAGAAAPNASIIYVYAPNAYAAAEYAIDRNLAPIISFSFGGCEKDALSKKEALDYARAMAQQAIAQGITWVASSGDTGPAGCEYQTTDVEGLSGFWVNLPASFPEVTGVGGTMFAEGSGTYWAGGSTKAAPTALSYIPETGWNDTKPGGLLAASGGGASKLFARPAWQKGPGVPTVNTRLVPDVSFAASWDRNFYVVVVNGETWWWGGTSAATPFFAGVVSILNQYLMSAGVQAKPGLGNINPKLYELAQTTSGVFHDITTGNNIVPCKTGTPDCSTGQYGFNAGPGWDPVTGLGSLDVHRFVLAWAGGSSNPVPGSAAASAVTLSAQPSPVYKQAADSDGFAWHFTLRLAETAGVATRITGFSIDGADYSGQIEAVFGGSTLPAYGALSGAMRAKIGAVPASRVFAFTGVDAGGLRWTRQITLTFLGEQVAAAMSLTSSPETVRQTKSGNCPAERPFYQELRLQELNGAGVRLTRFLAGSSDLTEQMQSWFGSLRLAPFGTLRTKICWQIDKLPETKSFEAHGMDAGGREVKAAVQVTFKSAALIPGTLAVSKSSVQLAASSGSASATLDVTLPGDEAWSVSTFPANQTSAWLSVTPKSGRGPKQVNLVASADGLAKGVYSTSLIFQSDFMTPQFVEVPVVFLVGVSGGATITAAQNAASFKPVFAPGMLMTLFGNNLANATRSAQSLPLPLALDGVSATINGVPAPLWFVSPGQINLQIPYETPIGAAVVLVNNNGQVGSHLIQVSATAPGIFNSSGAVVPAAEARRGSAASIYVTGDGEMTPMLETGAPPPADTPLTDLPKPRAPVKVTVGGVPAEVTFVGNVWLVGITQVNFTVPAGAPTGPQPVVVTVGNASSAEQMLMLR